MKKLSISVDGMSCGKCEVKIIDHFKENPSVSEVIAKREDNFVEISGADDLSNMTIRNELIDLGFSVNSIKKV